MLHSGSCLAAASLLMLSGAVGISSVDDDAGGQDDGDNSGDTSGDNSGDTSGDNSGDTSSGKVQEHTSGECAATSCWQRMSQDR